MQSTSRPPVSPRSPAATVFATLIASLAWLAFAAQADVTLQRTLVRGMTLLDGAERFSSYLTNLTVFLTAICFTCVAIHPRHGFWRFFSKPPVTTAVVLYMAFVGLAYNLLLRYLWTPSGYRAVLNEILHSALPLLCAVYWAGFVPRFHPNLRQCACWLVYPLGYLGIILWRGAQSDFYPYPFIDVDQLGLSQVLRNAGLLLIGFLVLMSCFLLFNHRRRLPEH
jgi:hypothetical protein